MHDHALARLAHENLVETLVACGHQVPGALVMRGDGVAVVCTGLPLRWFNQVLVTGPEAEAAAVERAVATAQAFSDRSFVNLRAGSDDRFVPLLERLGLAAGGEALMTPGLALDPLPEQLPGQPPELDLRRADDATGLGDHIAVAASGFGMPLEWLSAIMTEALLDHPAVTLRVGYRDGVAVTTGLGVRTGSVIGIYNIATVESARGKGYGAAVTMQLVADGAEADCEAAILQATPLARPMYERLGFRHVIEYRGYAPPSPD